MEIEARDFKDHLDELTAIVETLRAAIGAIAMQLPARAALLLEYDAATAALSALTQGQLHSERYLEHLDRHIAKTRGFLNPPP